MCHINTFTDTRSMAEMLADGQSVSTAAMREQQARTLNPDLARCGEMPECVGCEMPGLRKLPQIPVLTDPIPYDM